MIYKSGTPIEETEVIDLLNRVDAAIKQLEYTRAGINSPEALLVAKKEVEKYLKGAAITEDVRHMVSETFSETIDDEIGVLIDTCDDRIRELVRKRFEEFVEEKATRILEAAFRDTRKRFLDGT